MDASVLVSLSDSEENLRLPKPQGLLINPKLRLSCFVADFCRVSPANQKPSHVVKKSQLRINCSYKKPLRQVSPPRRAAVQNPFYYAFEGKKVSLTSLIESTPISHAPNSRNSHVFSIDSRTRSKDFRRLKWIPSRSQPTSYQSIEDSARFDQLSPTKSINKRRKFRTELIPQTKAVAFWKSGLVPELRINGTMKDISWRETANAIKEICDLTEIDGSEFNSN